MGGMHQESVGDVLTLCMTPNPSEVKQRLPPANELS